MNKKSNSAKIITIVFAFIIILLVFNIVYLGVSGIHLVSQSDIKTYAKNRGKEEQVIEATRGQIYTSDNEVIATNVKKYQLIAILDKNRPSIGNQKAYVVDPQETARTLAPILGMDEGALLDKLTSDTYQVQFGSYGSNLTSIVKAKIEDTGLPGLEFVEQTSRNYPMGNFCSYIIGYAQSMEQEDSSKVVEGQMGLEKLYNKELAGTNGLKIYQTDSKGYTLPNGVLKEVDAVNGNDMYLTIDSSLQRDLDLQLKEKTEQLKAEKATAVIMEAKTGKILALSSYPGYDPNTRKIDDYTNFFLDTAFECGSVFKPFIYANAIDDGVYNHSATYHSGTYDVKYGDEVVASIKDWNQGKGFGTITYDEGLYRSSNTAICSLLDYYCDKQSVINDLTALRFFQEGQLDGIASVSGIAGYEITDNRLEYLTTGFGQGATVTSLQLLRAYSVFANDGKMVEPYIIDRIVNPETNDVVYKGSTSFSNEIFSVDTCTQIKNLLLGVVESPIGTASQFKMEEEGIRIGGKTGTGQISDGTGYRTDLYTKSFVGLAPYDDPQIIIYIATQCDEAHGVTEQSEIVKSLVPAALATLNNYGQPGAEGGASSYTLDSYINQSTNYVSSKLATKEIQVQVIGNGATVMDQYPLATSSVSKSDRVFLLTDSIDIAMPNMTGWSRKDVATFGSLTGIQIVFENNGSVVGQSVPEGTILHAGDSITVKLQ